MNIKKLTTHPVLLSALVFSSFFSITRAETMVTFETSMGDIVIEVDEAKAPKSAENFVNYVKSGHYDDTIFHRIIAGFVVQGGGYARGFARKPTEEPIQNEADNGLKNKRGTLSMARTSDPHSATSQFFINLNDNDFLDHTNKEDGWGYAVFGKVTKGMDVVDAMAKIPTGKNGQDVPDEEIYIIKATVSP